MDLEVVRFPILQGFRVVSMLVCGPYNQEFSLHATFLLAWFAADSCHCKRKDV